MNKSIVKKTAALLSDGKPAIDLYSKNKDRFYLQEDWLYRDKRGVIYCVPKGTITDLASIPKWIFVWRRGKWDIGAIGHDWCYLYGKAKVLMPENDTNEYQDIVVTRKQADLLFYEVNQLVNVNPILNYLFYLALRLFGWVHFTKAQ